MDETKAEKGGAWWLAWLRRRIVPLVGLLLVIATMTGILYVNIQCPERIEKLDRYGYLGAFIISIVFNATIILPAGNILVQMTLGTTAALSPVLVGLAGGVGASIGETTGYIAGRSGRGLIKRSKMYGRVEDWVRKWGILTIFAFSIVPFIFDLVGIAAGVLRFPFWKFFLACMAGRIILYVTMVWLASLGYRVILPWFN
jgi:membrane protein YqaA with SNARE-associated domain